MSVDQHYPLTEQARARQATEAGEEAQIARLGIERQFSYQQRQGGRRTRYRGLDKNRLLGWAWGMYLNVTRLTRLAWDGQARPTEAHPTEAPFKSRAKAQLPGVDCA